MTDIRSKAALELLNLTKMRDDIAEELSDKEILEKDYSNCFSYNNDLKTFSVEDTFIPFADGSTTIMRNFLAMYSDIYEEESIDKRNKVIKLLWIIATGEEPDEEQREAIHDAVMLDEYIFYAELAYKEIQYIYADYYQVQEWSTECFYPVIVLVMALALADGRYIEEMYTVACQNLHCNDDNHVRAIKMLRCRKNLRNIKR